MKYINTSGLSDKEIQEAISFSFPEGVELNEIVIQSSENFDILPENSSFSRLYFTYMTPWGLYSSTNRAIYLFVPPRIDASLIRYSTYARIPIQFASISEWLVTTVAHELRHAWQHQVSKKYFTGDGLHVSMAYDAEIDAEVHSLHKLNEWRQIRAET